MEAQDLSGIRKCLERPVLAVTSGGPLPGEEFDLDLDAIEKAASGEDGEAVVIILKALNSIEKQAGALRHEVDEQLKAQCARLLTLCDVLEKRFGV